MEKNETITPSGDQPLYREVLTHVNGRKKFKQNPGLPPRQDSENKRPTSLLAEPGNDSRLEIRGAGSTVTFHPPAKWRQ